jgi:cell division septation protein DedD
MKKLLSIALIGIWVCSGAATAHAQSRGGFAVVPAPGQPTVPAPVTPPATVAPQPPLVPRPTPPTAQQQQQQQQEQLRIVADPATNSLIIYGTAQEFQNIKNILKDLDAVPRQVLLDVLIAEVTLDDSEQFGVDYEIARGTTSIFGKTFGSRGAVLGRVLSQLGAPSASGISLFPGGMSGVIGTGGEVRALINALMTDSRTKILSSPSILATDNRPARIQIGQEEPIATGSTTVQVGTPASTTTIQYRNTGRIVTIIPQVNSQGLVNLQILAEVSAARLLGRTVGQDQYPVFDIRQAETTAVVQDNETLAIGGIIAENAERTRRGIPYLMNIPVFGRFFGSTSDSIIRTELIMLITPHVIRGRDESRQATDEFRSKMSSVRAELERLERERAKLKPKPRPQEPALMPEPNVIEPGPQPTPSSFVPQRGASITPDPTSVTVLSNVGATQMTPQRMTEVKAPPPVDYPKPATGSFGGDALPVAAKASPPSTPAYVLSLGQPQSPAPMPATRPVAERQSERKQSREWAVQVAAHAARKDADTMALGLRKSGYEAYVMTVQSENKTWYRVRVGQFSDIASAKQVRQSLVDVLQLKGAYVAAN